MRFLRLAAVTIILCAAPACNEPGLSTVTFQRQALPGVSFDTAFAAAEQAMSERFRVSQRDRETGVIRGEDRTATVDDGGVRPISTSRQSRRVAEIRVQTIGDDSEVYCQVFLQENQTAAVTSVSRSRSIDDQPFETPAERDAATTPQQNTIWHNRSRDRVIERQMIESVREIVSRTTSNSG